MTAGPQNEDAPHRTSGWYGHGRATRTAIAAVALIVCVALAVGFVGGVSTQTDDFRWAPTEPTVGEPVTFDVSGYDADGDQYRWWFGDGETAETDGPSVQHTYEEAGTYTVSFATDGARDYTEIVVSEPQSPTAAFDWEPDQPTAGQTVTFDASDSTSPNGEIERYRWLFEGGGYGDWQTESTTTYTFETAGMHVVGLEVEDEADQRDSYATEAFQIEEPQSPTAAFEWTPPQPIAGQAVTFDASDSTSPNGEIERYRWLFEGGGYGDWQTESTTTHTFETAGMHVVGLEVEDEAGQRDSYATEAFQVGEPQSPTAVVDWEPDQPIVGETVSFDASDSTSPNGEIVEYRWDVTGDGSLDDVTTEPTISHTYDEEGGVVIGLEVEDEVGQTADTGAEFSVAPAETPPPEPDEPIARCTIEPTTVGVGETVVVDASASADADAISVDFQGDGQWDVRWADAFVHETSFDEPGTYEPVVRAWGELERHDDVTCPTVTVEDEPADDFPGTGEDTDEPSDDRPGTEEGDDAEDSPVDDAEDSPVDDAEDPPADDAEDPPSDDEAESIVPPPIRDNLGLVAIGLLTLLGLGWAAISGPLGGGGSSGSGGRPTPMPKSPGGGDEPARYETGVVTLPTAGGPVSVTDVGFEPDLLVFTATTADATDGDVASDRTVGWTQGIAVQGEDTLEQHAVTVADDARSTERGTCGTSTGDAFELAVHGDRSLGTLQGSVTAMTDDGFDLTVRTTGSDAAIDGQVRLLYQAFATGTALDVDAGTFLTPTEPGRQHVPLDIDASVVTLATSTAVGGLGETWTTDRSIGVSMGAAASPGAAADGGPTDARAAETDGGLLEQAVWSASVWPGRSNDAAARCGTDGALALCYQDGDRIAGRTTATVTGLGERLELQFDRTYSGPHKIDPTGAHPVQYLAIDAGELTPAVGAVRLPAPDETLAVDCGFEPGLIEVTTSRSAALDHARHTGDVPFGWATGTAIVRDGVLAQYALSGAGSVPDPDIDLDSFDVAEPADAGGASTAGEVGPVVATPGVASGAVDVDPDAIADRLPEGFEPTAAGPGTDDDEDSAEAIGDVLEDPSDVELTDGGTDEAIEPAVGDGLELSDDARDRLEPDTGPGLDPSIDPGPDLGDRTADDGTDEFDSAAPTPPGDGHVASTLAVDDDGEIVGRDTVRVASVDSSGFALAVEGLRVTDHDRSAEARPYVWYRAWPTTGAGTREFDSAMSKVSNETEENRPEHRDATEGGVR
ncbi:PKD domain-containing protein [Natronobeatus ordinarius]|uniref:PKD domain-containing protein n=1 Tax=Natronobeatus ordinarius TaxID=2963433 RepID=UPI0020CBFD9A|nr:PKD domain-containing protein [Natronobeatus ordinarius]